MINLSSKLSSTSLVRQMNERVPVIAIGASTGGPGALAKVLSGLSPPIEACIVIVQHIFPDGVAPLASWLTTETGHPVTIARAGDHIAAGKVFLASGEGHLVLRMDGSFGYKATPVMFHTPSISVLFESIAQHRRNVTAGVLLTGMGDDGASGLLAMKKKSFLTIAQDEASCAVYGMPRAAVRLQAATEVLALSNIADRLNCLLTKATR